jgi:hypothetical protein
MEDKSVRISADTHEKLVEFVSRNPIIKLNKLADIGISKLLTDLENPANSNILFQPKPDLDSQ